MRRLFLALLACCSCVHAEEGLWPLDRLPLDTLQKNYDFTPPQNWQQDWQHASLRLNGGCSAAFVSDQGLVMTNQHCVSRCLAQLSGPRHNLLEDGFLAEERDDEAICPELSLSQLLKINDITENLATATRDLSPEQAPLARQAAIEELQKRCTGGDHATRCEVVQEYGDSRTLLYQYRRFRDVRLVFAPEAGIAHFGGSTDSFSFPRYAVDVSLLRVYVDGQPHQPSSHFPPLASGPHAGQLVFVTGHPGSTQRNLTVAQLATLRDVILPQRLAYLAELRGVLSQFTRQGPRQRRMAERELLSIESSLKAFRGRHAALSEPGFMDARRRQEQALRDQAGEQTASAWEAIAESQLVWREIYTRYSLLELMRGFQSDLVSIARHLVRAGEQLSLPDPQRLPEYREAALPQLTQRLFSAAPIHAEMETLTLGWSLRTLRELLGPDDPAVQISLDQRQPETLAESLITDTQLNQLAVRRQLWEGGSEAIEASDDPLIKFVRDLEPAARAVRARYAREVLQVVADKRMHIDRLRFAVRDDNSYPDANFTLRVSYGQVKGWKDHSRVVSPFTTLAGAMARTSEHAPFILPSRWQQAEAALDLATPVNFTTSHDIVSGNSGSPVLDAQGRLVGLIFDGNLHSLGGAYAYDGRYNRAIALHPAILKAALQSVYDAPALVEELFGAES